MNGKTHPTQALAFLLAVLLMFGIAAPGLAEATSRNPLLDPQPITSYTPTKDRFFHLLLVGIDYGLAGQWGSGHKTLDNCHTDAVMVVSINLDHPKLTVVSLPRDTLTYVPGVKGIYKLNAAINCAADLESGMKRICDAVSWLLGGIQIDKYIAVDMRSMIALGDAIGGVDFDVDMEYTGTRRYFKGMQHLDGQGILDYVRARHNATVDANDLGRTGRQRAMMLAIFKKIKNNIGLVNDLFTVMQSDELNILKNVHTADAIPLLPILVNLSEKSVGSYVLSGSYRMALIDWNFTFTDQENRQTVLQAAYGIDAAQIPYVSFEYTKWLLDQGITTARYILLARQLMNYGKGLENLTDAQASALTSLELAHDAAVQAFDQAADTLTSQDTTAMAEARRAMQDRANAAAKMLNFPEISWRAGQLWYRDDLINEFSQIDWR